MGTGVTSQVESPENRGPGRGIKPTGTLFSGVRKQVQYLQSTTATAVVNRVSILEHNQLSYFTNGFMLCLLTTKTCLLP